MSRKELEAALREGGEKVTQGRLRIDASRALQRLRDFRFADPSHWVLEVLRAAVLSGAKRVTARTDADDVELDFDGEPFAAEAMAHLLEHALNPGTTDEERRTRLLALGVAGALGAGARFVTVRSGGVKLTLTPEGVTRAEEAGRGTSLHLRKAFGWRVASAFFRGSPERAAIVERTPRYPLPLQLDGQRVTAPRGRPPLDTRSAQGAGWRLEATVPLGPPLPRSTLELDVAGVLVARRELELPGVQVHAWLRGDGLRRNASGSDVVDDDPTLQQALAALRGLSVELLERRVRALEDDQEAWRHHFLERLVQLAPRPKKGGAVEVVTFDGPKTAVDPRVRELLSRAKVLPGPAGEYYSPAELEAAVEKDGRLHVATERHPEGSYPRPTVYLPPGSGLALLLPKAKHVDVADLVKRRARIAARRAEVASLPVETARLPEEGWLAWAPLHAAGLEGEVGITADGHGAFVRVLTQGRLLEAGELQALAPLQLRAVVNLRSAAPDAWFDPQAGAKVLAHCADAVAAAAEAAIVARLPAPELAPAAKRLLAWLVLTEEKPLKALPAALKAMPLFPCVDGPPASLDQLLQEGTWAFTRVRRAHGRLDGSRVLHLDDAELAVLERLGKKRLEDATRQLDHEAGVRRRLAGPTRAPRLEGAAVEVAVRGEGVEGLVGLPRASGSQLSLELLRRGVPFETTTLTARYHHALASMECAALEPNARWDGVRRDDAFARVTAAVAEAERRLALALAEKPDAARTPGGRLYVLAFLKKELTPFTAGALDDVTRAFAAAPLFDTVNGPCSLEALAASTRGGEPLLWLPAGTTPGTVPPELLVLTEPPALVTALGEALARGTEQAGARLAKLAALARLERLPVQPFEVSNAATLQVDVSHDGLRVRAGLAPGVDPQASARVCVGGRLVAVESLPCSLPLEAVVEWADLVPTLDGRLATEQREQLSDALVAAALEVTRRGLQAPNVPDGRRALLLALGRHLDGALPSDERGRLVAVPVFDCTDGRRRSASELAEHGTPLRVVTSALEGSLPDERPIVRATDAAAQVGMRRWGTVEHVDALLAAQLEALAARARVAAVQEVLCAAPSPWRRRVETPVARGEVVVSRAHAGRLELYLDRRPLVTLDGALPAPLVAAVDAPGITPTPGFTGVEADEKLKAVVDAVTEAGLALADDVAAAGRGEGPDDARVQLAFWVAGLAAWRWRGQKKAKKGKAKGKKKGGAVTAEAPATHPLTELKLLRQLDGSACSIADLVARGRVEYSTREGARFDAAQPTWWPREGELAWAKALGLDLADVTKEVEFTAVLRARPRLAPKLPHPGPWLKPVTGPGLVGEAQLAETPSSRVVLEVLRDGVLVETLDEPRPVGGVARVEASEVTPNADWSAVKRDGAFKALLAAVDAALAASLEARLQVRHAFWRGWALFAVEQFGRGRHALSGVVAQLPLLADLAGATVTPGAVLAQATQDRRVRLARAGTPPPEDGGLVLRDETDTRKLLGHLGLEFDDVTEELRRRQDLKASLAKRRLSSLAWKGEALARHAITTPGLAGELAISADGSAGLTLAREGIAVGPLDEAWPGVVGVVDLADLSVDADWKTFALTRPQRAALRAEVDQLYVALAAAAPQLRTARREQALEYTLARLGELGVEAPGHLERLEGAARAQAEAPWFETVQGERVNLLAVAAEVTTRQRVAVTAERALATVARDELVLHASSLEAPWLDALGARFGKTRVWRVPSVAAWNAAKVEAEPLDGTPEALGLRLLRRELRLLRAGALGRLTPEDLEDVRLHRAGGAVPVRYARQRKLVLLDPEHPLIARTLAEAKARPERLFVLLATVFGHVNRELKHVTDEHEAQLLLALAGHLAANPKLLSTPR